MQRGAWLPVFIFADEQQAGRLCMGWARLMIAVFWVVALGNLLWPFAQPFSAGLAALAGLLLFVHVVLLLLGRQNLREEPRPWLECLQIVLFGAFHQLPDSSSAGR
jgi:putative membrane protein